MSSLIDKLKSIFETPSGEELLLLPESLKIDINETLENEESLVFSIRALSAKYKAPRLIDSNTFFNPYFILTNSRIIIARNSSRLNVFREIELRNIIDHKFEISSRISSLSMKLYNSRDIVTFHSNTSEQTESLKNHFDELVGALSASEEKKLYCRFCGEKIPADSNFCPDCGSRQ